MVFVVPRQRPLAELLSAAESADLEVLADLITDNGKGRLALDSGIKAIIVKRKNDGALQSIADVLESEVRAFGGNTVVNLFRSDAVSYEELAADVAKKLGVKPTPGADIFSVEASIISEVMRRRASAHATAHPTCEAATSADLDLAIRELAEAAGTTAGTVVSKAAAGATGAGGAAGTVGMILAARGVTTMLPPAAILGAGATVYQALGPAFRITVPAVLQIAKIRRKQYETDFAIYQEELQACL